MLVITNPSGPDRSPDRSVGPQFTILGPPEIVCTDATVRLSRRQTRILLAAFLTRPNRVISRGQLIDALWPGEPTDRSARKLHVQICQLRRALREAGAGDRLINRAPGYLFRVEDHELDARLFETALQRARLRYAIGDLSDAEAEADAALALWRGPALHGVADGGLLRTEADILDEARLAALELRNEIRLARGLADERLPELAALTAAHPLQERFWAQRMIALYRAGLPCQALQIFAAMRQVLRRELGVDPSAGVLELARKIERRDERLLPDAGERPAFAAAGTMPVPPTRYATNGDVHIAYQVTGDGERDILFVPGAISHLDLWWEDHATSRFLHRMAESGRLIIFDKRDTGLSDRSPDSDTLADRMDDMLAVMAACDCDRATVVGFSEGAAMSLLFAATHPDRVDSLVLAGASARWSAATDYPEGLETEPVLDALEQYTREGWGQGRTIEWFSPSCGVSARMRAIFGRWERLSATPAAYLRILGMIRELDIRPFLTLPPSGSKVERIPSR